MAKLGGLTRRRTRLLVNGELSKTAALPAELHRRDSINLREISEKRKMREPSFYYMMVPTTKASPLPPPSPVTFTHGVNRRVGEFVPQENGADG